MKRYFFTACLLIISSCSATIETYFAGETISPNFIDSPYATNSKEWGDDVAQILKMQKNFNVNELELASREKYLRPEVFVLYADRSLTRESYPNLYLLIDRVSATSKSANDNVKNHWNVARPYTVDKRINMLITPSPGAAYPSGHASSSLVTTQILGMLLPQRSQDLNKLAKKIASRRVLVGMHYPHDIIAGEQLGRLIIGGLLQNKDFQKDLGNARKELEKNPPKGPAPSVKNDVNSQPVEKEAPVQPEVSKPAENLDQPKQN